MNEMQETPVSSNPEYNIEYEAAVNLASKLLDFKITVQIMVKPPWSPEPLLYPGNYFLDCEDEVEGEFLYHEPQKEMTMLHNVAQLHKRLYDLDKTGLEQAAVLYEVFQVDAINLPTWLHDDIDPVRESMSDAVSDMLS